jgi:hypothetical protein
MNEINDHIRHLAFAMASIADTMFMVNDNPTEYKTDIEGLVPTDKDEVTFEKINNDIITSFSNIYETPTKASYINFNYLVQGSLNNQQPLYYSTSPRSWGSGFYNYTAYAGFNYQNTDYYTLLRIPEWQSLHNDANRLNKTFLVIPHEVDNNGDYLLPIVGYKMNTTTWEVDTVLFQTEDEMENDIIHYIWVVDCDMSIPSTQNPGWNCIGDQAPQQNDGFCDTDCGENSTNSLNDCNPIFLRKVWIDEIEITEDYKQKCGTNYQWNENRLHGHYEIAYQSMTVHGSGKIKKRGGLLNEYWARDDVYKTKKIGLSCNFNTKGSANNKL